jgi:hypothetical protein
MEDVSFDEYKKRYEELAEIFRAAEYNVSLPSSVRNWTGLATMILRENPVVRETYCREILRIFQKAISDEAKNHEIGSSLYEMISNINAWVRKYNSHDLVIRVSR